MLMVRVDSAYESVIVAERQHGVVMRVVVTRVASLSSAMLIDLQSQVQQTLSYVVCSKLMLMPCSILMLDSHHHRPPPPPPHRHHRRHRHRHGPQTLRHHRHRHHPLVHHHHRHRPLGPPLPLPPPHPNYQIHRSFWLAASIQDPHESNESKYYCCDSSRSCARTALVIWLESAPSASWPIHRYAPSSETQASERVSE